MRKTTLVDKDTLHAAIKSAITANSGMRISLSSFLAVSKLRRRDFYQHYTKWEEAMRGAGFKFKHYHMPARPGALLAEWGAVVRKLRRFPTQVEYAIHGPRSGGALGLQFGSWFKIPGAFRRFARKRKEWAGVLALMDTLPQRTTKWTPKSQAAPRPRFMRKPRSFKSLARPMRRMSDRPEFGDQLDLPALRHAPSNEQGVVYLFGILAERLGFAVERMQMAFPDCIAKRRHRPGASWQNVTIEFEFESRNFRDHRHDPRKCDIIICWEHNWPDCPENIEVISLQEAIKRLKIGSADS